MKSDNSERIKELKFEYKGEQYKFERDELSCKSEYGFYANICDIPISYTKYANDKDVIEFVCKMALCTHEQGVIDGMNKKEREIRNVLGIRE